MTWKQTFHFYLRVLAYFKDSVGRLLLQVAMMGVGIELGVLGVFPLAIFIDLAAGKHPMGSWEYRLFFSLAPASIPGQIAVLAIAMLVLRLGQEVLSMLQTLIGIRVGYVGLVKVRCDLFRKLQELQLAYHKSQPQGDAIYRLSYDCFGFQSILNLFVQTMLVSILTLGLMLSVMISMNWLLTLVAMAVVPPLVWASSHYAKVFHTKTMAAKEADSQLTTAIQRSISSIEVVQAFGREAEEFARFHGTVDESVKKWLKLHWEEVCYWLVLGSIFGIGGAMIFGLGGWMVYRDQFVRHDPNGFTVGTLSAFLAYLTQLYGPLNKLSGSGSSLQNGVAGAQRVFEVLDRDVTITDRHDAISLPPGKRTLEFESVGFSYRDGEMVLRDVTVRIEPGQMVAFVGSSGVGKTTLLNLLPRFYDPTHGSLKLDGRDLRKLKLKDLRRHVALVLQDHSILPATIAENIAYGTHRADARAIARAAAMAGAAEFIEKMPDKYQTMVGERASNLSGGQRQRIGIARALLAEAPIMVLDEPTSALDPMHEAIIVKTLRELKGSRTMVIVSHRLSTVTDCDQIFVMEQGSVVEKGTHDQLLAMRGIYFEMAKLQLKIEDGEPEKSVVATDEH